ncbi:MAG TPA: RNA 3'-terminal phosphate cyclase [Trichocoleus sp.]|jgi:RNA 3'-terminal phosphate cyclase (ATP)
MLQIDGSYGEGGGQILRTSLSLAAITGQPIRIDRIRANRKTPGLGIQHLTGVRAIAEICLAQVEGDALGSTTLEFVPTSASRPGQYRIDVEETLGRGSAGATTLILQTVLLPLALVQGESKLWLKGGTHVAWSPSATYIEQVYLPMLRSMGVEASLHLKAWGWYPQGNGEIEVQIQGTTEPLQGIVCLERGELQQVQGLAVVTELPSHIPQRMASRAQNLLQQANLKANVQPLRARGIAPGAGIFLTAEYEQSRAGFGAVGKLGLAAEKVAELAVQDLLIFHQTDAPIDPHLADQLLLPAALAATPTQYRVAEITLHLQTNAWVIEQFGLAKVTIDPATQIITVMPAHAPPMSS